MARRRGPCPRHAQMCRADQKTATGIGMAGIRQKMMKHPDRKAATVRWIGPDQLWRREMRTVHHDASVRSQDAPSLVEHMDHVGHMLQHVSRDDEVEVPVGQWPARVEI